MKRAVSFVFVIVLVLMTAAALMAAPEFVCLNAQAPTQTGPSEWKFDYMLSNYGGTADIYDVELSGFEYGWIYMEAPPNWSTEIITGPMARFVTDSAPCTVEDEMYGFAIYAATPMVGSVSVYYTDVAHRQITSGTTQFPLVPEPGSLFALGSGLLGLGGIILRRYR